MQQVIARHQDDLQLPSAVDKGRFLAAVAMVESTGGRNWQPNFEAAFWEGGVYWSPKLAKLRDTWTKSADPEMAPWCGKAVACSWGPWQVLYVTATELGYQGPPWLLTDPDTCLQWAIALFNKRLVGKLPAGLTDLGIVGMLADGYNSGSFKDTHVPLAYIQAVRGNYQDDSILSKLVIL